VTKRKERHTLVSGSKPDRHEWQSEGSERETTRRSQNWSK